MRILFDVDGTLIDYEDNPREEVINLLKTFADSGFGIIVWSGGGSRYAKHMVERLNLEDYVIAAMAKSQSLPDSVAFVVDDMKVDFGVPVLYVGHELSASERLTMIKQQQRALAINESTS